MSESRWRGPDYLRDNRREYIRKNLPSGSAGFIAEDLDLIVRHFGPQFHLDAIGRLRLVEIKVGRGLFGASKRQTLGLLHDMCATSQHADRYDGFYVIYSKTDDWDSSESVSVNGLTLSHSVFQTWLTGGTAIHSVHPYQVPSNVFDWRVDQP